MKALALALFLFCPQALADSVIEIQDANQLVVGHVGWFTVGPPATPLIVTGWRNGCANVECNPMGGTPKGVYPFITDGSELWHQLRIYFEFPNCPNSGNIYFTVNGSPDPASNVDASGRNAMCNNREYALQSSAPAFLPNYQSYKDPLSSCVNATGTAPGPVSLYRAAASATANFWTPPYTVR